MLLQKDLPESHCDKHNILQGKGSNMQSCAIFPVTDEIFWIRRFMTSCFTSALQRVPQGDVSTLHTEVELKIKTLMREMIPVAIN
jgi:hypothetical protein